jgi:hypothetical protein
MDGMAAGRPRLVTPDLVARAAKLRREGHGVEAIGEQLGLSLVYGGRSDRLRRGAQARRNEKKGVSGTKIRSRRSGATPSSSWSRRVIGSSTSAPEDPPSISARGPPFPDNPAVTS